jgi:hypothetical protein
MTFKELETKYHFPEGHRINDFINYRKRAYPELFK